MIEIKTPAIVLQTFDAKESDLVVVLLSPTEGKIRAFAKGAKKSKKRFFGNIEIFTKANFLLTKKKAASDLFLIETLENKVTPLELRNSLNHFLIVGLTFELVDKCFAEVDQEANIIYENLNKLLLIANNLPPFSNLICLATYNLLLLGQMIGVDPLHSTKSFRQDDLLWFREMLNADKPLSYEPLQASFRALKSLANYLRISMDLKINSMDSLNMIKLTD